MSIGLTNFEKDVMRMLLQGEDPALAILRSQLDVSHVAHREFTGAGFYTTFSVPSNAPRLGQRKSFHFGDVSAEIQGLEFGAGFVVHVQDGCLDYLEGYSYEEGWPAEIGEFQLMYSEGKRDLPSLCKNWS